MNIKEKYTQYSYTFLSIKDVACLDGFNFSNFSKFSHPWLLPLKDTTVFFFFYSWNVWILLLIFFLHLNIFKVILVSWKLSTILDVLFVYNDAI